jgi:subtilisin family serine protease
VISVSDGVPLDTLEPAVEADVVAAIDEARSAGVVVVVSAGNDGAAGLRWPGLLAQVIGVASVNDSNEPSSWTSYGPEVDVAAPGECIYTTRVDGTYGYFEGTSASAPIVAALAALLISDHQEWSVDEVVARIRSSATPASFDGRPDVDGQLGAGVVSFSGAF